MTLPETLALVRPHLTTLQPYSSARDEFDDSAIDPKRRFIYLDANENPFDTGYNRYPDPHQRELKKRISRLKGVGTENIFLGNGSDEAIDLIIRLFCDSGENIVIPYPTYGMYKVSAAINNVEVKTVLMNEDFQIGEIRETGKVLFLCSPNNPSGNLVDCRALVESFEGIVVVDEAYIDFAPGNSILPELDRHPNLIVLQTFSKAWGLAGLRLGMAFAHREIISLLDKIKPPYNINSATQQLALDALGSDDRVKLFVDQILQERRRIAQELGKLTAVKRVFPSDSNFLLVRIDRAAHVYRRLIEDHIVVRDRSQVKRCEDCLRITIGTKEENDQLMNALRSIQ